ncbi:MAG: type II toxin-antitoxin system ParD family antitoxin [Gammaproteobacteria bacterium]|nr:type II toxin-antitoxin system ParD family antitoxin [Gammaproteobacteria bacterium]
MNRAAKIGLSIEDTDMPSSYAVGKQFESFIRQQVETGQYATASEVVRDALRLLKDRLEEREIALDALRMELNKGLTPGKTVEAEEVFDCLKRKYGNLREEGSG